MSDAPAAASAPVAVTPPRGGLREFVIVGAWLGLVYGFVEAMESCVLALFPGALTWRSGNSARILWVAPIVYGATGAALGVVFCGLARSLRRVDWTMVFVFVVLVAGGYLAARLQGQVFSSVASLLLALGIGVQLTRWFLRRRASALRMMRRSVAPLALLVAAIAVGELSVTAALERSALKGLPVAGSRPNVLVLVADTLRADHVSTYGYARPTTPRIDRFAAEGETFVDAYSTSSWTLPAHASLMTGRRLYEHRAGEDGHFYLDRRFATLAEVLGRAGYASGGFVGNTFWCGRQTGLDRGFVHYEDFYGKWADALVRTVLGRKIAYDVLPRAGFIDIPGRMHAADINDRMLRWIDALGDRPFFAFANYMDVHGPYVPPPSMRGHFGAAGPARNVGEIELGAITAWTKIPNATVLRAWIDRYDESLLYLDGEIGRLLDELARRGVLDRTIVVFAADHGENWGEHELLYHGNSLYQEQIRIPLIVRYPPRVAAGQRESRPVTLEQIPRFVTELAGIEGAPFPGAAMTDGPDQGAGDVAVSEVSRRPGVPPTWPTASGGLRSVQTGRWQLIVHDAGTTELYDLEADPRQANNLAADPRMAEVRSALERRLSAEIPEQASRVKTAAVPGR